MKPNSPSDPTPAPFSLAVQVLASGRPATKAAVALQMKVSPRKAASLYRQMQQRYCAEPTLFHLALFSGETELMAMIQRLQQAGALES